MGANESKDPEDWNKSVLDRLYKEKLKEGERFLCVARNGTKLFKYVRGEGSDMVIRHLEGRGISIGIINNKYIFLHIGEKKPIFNKGFRVLALKPKKTECSEYDVTFYNALVIEKPENHSRMYTLKFDGDSETTKVRDDFIIPPEQFWTDEKDEYGELEKDEDKNKEEETAEEDTSSDEESDLSEKHHHKHHKKHHHKHHKNYTKNQQIILVPIIIPYYYY